MKIRIIGPDDPALAAARNQIRSHPEWNLELQVYPWAAYRDVLMETLNAELAPNQAVFVPGHVWIPELAAAGLLTSLNSLLRDLPEAAWKDYAWEDIIPAVQQESLFQDQLYMIPYFNDAHILFYRKDLIRLEGDGELPEISPLDLADLAGAVHRPPEVYGVALKAHPSEILFDWLPFLMAAGGRIADAELRPAFFSDEGVQALTAYCRLREFAPPQTHTFGNEEIAAVLKSGQAALAATWGGQAAPIFLDESNPFREVYLPALYPYPCGGTWGTTIPANQPRDSQLQALEALLALNNPESDREVLLAAGSPVRRSSYTEHALESYSWLKAQREVYQRLAFLPVDPRASLFLGPLTEAIVNAFLGDKSPRDALREAESRIIAALDE